MANSFKLKTKSNIGQIADTIYTCPTSTSATIIGLTVANIFPAAIAVSVQLENNDGDDIYIIKNAPVAFGGALVPIGGDQKVVLEENDSIKVSSNEDDSIDVSLSILEIT